VLAGHSGPVIAVAFSIDGRRLVSGGNDKTIKVWDAAMGTELLTLRGHRDGVTCVAFSRDGRLLISGSRDKTIRLWDSGPRKSGGGTP
jgi:WD40 repeat protein